MAISRRRFVALIPVVALIFALALPAVALADDGSGRFSIFDSVTVGPDEVINGDVGSLFSSVNVQGHVTGGVFSIFSSVNISGKAQVDRTAFSIFSSVAVRDTAVVTGDVMTVFSFIDKADSARIGGKQILAMGGTGAPRAFNFNVGTGESPWRGNWNTGRNWSIGRILGGIFSAFILAAAAVVTAILFPRRVSVVKDTMVHSPWSSLGVGFLGLILSVPLTILLACTCIGGIVVLLGAFLGILLGLVAVGMWIGDRVMDTTSNTSRSPMTDVLVGALILGLVMATMGIVPVISWFSGFVWFGLFCLSFGAVLLSRFGSMPPLAPAPVLMPAPPVPPAPVVMPAPSVPPAPPTPPAETTPDVPAQS